MAPSAISSLPLMTPMMSGLACSMALHLVVALGAVPVGHFLWPTFFRSGYWRQHGLVAVGARGGIVVRRAAEELDIVALLADRLPPIAGAPSAAPWALLETSCALARPSWLISALTRKTGMPAATAFFTAPIEPSGIGRIEDDRDRLVGDRGVDQVALGVGVALVTRRRWRIAELLRLSAWRRCLRSASRVGRIDDDDRHQAVPPRRSCARRADRRGAARQQCACLS